MSSKPTEQDSLRTEAEAQLAHTPPTEAQARSTEELLHELRVHQSELEMQNDELRRAQILIEESRDRYVDLYDFAPVGYLTLSRNGMIDEINLTGAALLGVERNKLTHRRFALLVASEDRDSWHQHFMRAMQLGERQSCELALKRGDGSIFHARLDSLKAPQGFSHPEGVGDSLSSCELEKSSRLPTKIGNEFSIRVALTDISERKRIESEISQSRMELEELYDKAPCGYHSLDREGRIVRINQTEADWLGYERDEMIGKRILDFQTPLSAEVFAKNYPRFKQEGHLEVEMVRKDGTIFPVLLSANVVNDADGNFVMSRSTMVDVTELKKAENKLIGSEEKFRQLFEKAPIGIAMAEQDQKIFAANAAFCKMFGYTQEELSSMTIADMTHPDYVALTRQMVKGVLEGEVPAYSLEKKYVRKDGNVFWGHAVATAIAGHDPQARYIIGMVEDITERVEQEELRLAKVREQRDVLVREVHHRIKNNLQGVVGLLWQHAIDHPEMADMIELITGRVYSIAIIHGLQAQTLSEEVDLDGLMKSILDASGYRMEYESGLRHSVFLNREEAVPIALVLNELLTNACKHRSANSSLPAIRLKMSGDYAIITIANHFDASRPAAADGGQGLTLVKSLLPRKSANLVVVRAGDIFTVELKLSPPVTMPGLNEIQ